MNRIIFDSVVLGNLTRYYERKPPTHDTADLWYGRCERIPDEAAEWIVRRIQDTSDAWPRNLPAALNERCREWLDTYPEKRAISRATGCPHCDSGYVYALHTGRDGRQYRFVFRCAICDQAGENGVPTWRNLLREENYLPMRWRDLAGLRMAQGGITRDLGKLADMVGEQI